MGSSEITASETSFGSFVSVSLVRADDTDDEVAGFFLRQLDSRSGPKETFLTIGVQQTSAMLLAQTAAKELE